MCDDVKETSLLHPEGNSIFTLNIICFNGGEMSIGSWKMIQLIKLFSTK